MIRSTFLTPALANLLIAMACCGWLAGVTRAAPNLTNVTPRGLQIGAKTNLVLEGQDLLPDPQVVLSVPVAKQVVKAGASPTRVEIELTLDENVSPGIHCLRVANSIGISNAVVLGVDRLMEKPFSDQVESLPIAFYGNLIGSQILRTQLAGGKGLPLVVDVEARRLGSSLKPALRLYDEQGVQLAFGLPKNTISGDARLQTTLPADGRYTVELHDLVYRGQPPGYFRLKIGELQFADMVYPIGVSRGRAASLGFVSTNLPADTRVEFDAEGDDWRDQIPAPVPAAGYFTGAAPTVMISPDEEVVEVGSASSSLQAVAGAPVGVNGRILESGEVDRYLLPVTVGATLRFDVKARQIGSPLDAVLTIRDEAGRQLATGDDRPGTTDPGLDFKVPGNLNKLIVELKDLLGRGGDDYIYRIGVRDAGQPDFDLAVDTDQINVPAGGTQVIKVQVTRAGYDGPIELSIDQLPTGVQLAGDRIPAGGEIGLLTLTAPASEAVFGLASVVGRGTASQTKIARVAKFPTTGLPQLHHFRGLLGIAITQPAPIQIAWRMPDADEKLLLGGYLPIGVKLGRADGVSGDIRVRLLTSQVVPKTTVKKDNQDQVVDDVERTLRLEAIREFEPGVEDATLEITTPADLPEQHWAVVLVAELLSADKKSAVATVATPARYLHAVRALAIELSSPPSIEATAGDGDTGQFTGKVTRMPGLQQPVTVTLMGLPEQYPAPQVVVPADQLEFTLPVRFPADSKPVELKDITVTATALTDPENPRSIVRSNTVPVTIKLLSRK
jgi:hypothetical protein